jgi:hypothetical protein
MKYAMAATAATTRAAAAISTIASATSDRNPRARLSAVLRGDVGASSATGWPSNPITNGTVGGPAESHGPCPGLAPMSGRPPRAKRKTAEVLVGVGRRAAHSLAHQRVARRPRVAAGARPGRHSGRARPAFTGSTPPGAPGPPRAERPSRELMRRIGHSSTRAAMINQHATRERHLAIAAALDGLIEATRGSGSPVGDPAVRKPCG